MHKLTIAVLLTTVIVIVLFVYPFIVTPEGHNPVELAQEEVHLLKDAVRDYLAAYDNLPVKVKRSAIEGKEPHFFEYSNGWYDNDDAREVVLSLMGVDSPGIPNPSGTVFLESDRVEEDGTFKDPWGAFYKFKFDVNYNGTVEYYSGGLDGIVGENVSAVVLVISPGPNGRLEDPANAASDDILSHRFQVKD